MGLTTEPPCGSLSSVRRFGVEPTNVLTLISHAISRGVMGLSFQGPGGETGLPSGGAEPSPRSRSCQRDFRWMTDFFLSWLAAPQPRSRLAFS